MEQILEYKINGKSFAVNVPNDQIYKKGYTTEAISNSETDITSDLPWYEDGFGKFDLFTEDEFIELLD